MHKLTKQAVIDAYNDLVKKKGHAVGSGVFNRETGISRYNWAGGFWRSWSAFQKDAGHKPNLPTPKIPDAVVIRSFAELALEQARIPTEADLVLKRREDSNFPNHLRFRRWGNRQALLERVAEFCATQPEFEPVTALLGAKSSTSLERKLTSFQISGFVYLLRSGKHYKLGRTNATGRRLRELAIQLPEKPNMVHAIETDDPAGIEEYWHKRFADKREGGEWFTLSADDVKAFKKRRFQ